MSLRADFECPNHGVFEYRTRPGEEILDLCACPRCGAFSPWKPTAPAVHTPETRKRALLGYAKDSNPW